MNLKCEISNRLKEMGVPAHLKGYHYLRSAIERGYYSTGIGGELK